MNKTLATLTAVLLFPASVCLLPNGSQGERPGATRAEAGGRESETKTIFKEDVVYGRVQGAGLLADLAYAEGKGPFPVILSVHGGRWFRESKTTHSAIKVRQWAGLGFFAMSIDYRLIGCTPAPACYQDVLCAIRWLHAHAGRYPIDARRIFLIGQSAGGHLVSLAATLGPGSQGLAFCVLPWLRCAGWARALRLPPPTPIHMVG